MKILVHDVFQQFPVTAHILESDPTNPDMYAPFHCWKCGKLLFQFNGTCILSQPGPISSGVPVIHFCRNCKHRHLVSSII